jgi:CelD/BcsL family acetyltransferase involved in cellulose biosynthesis
MTFDGYMSTRDSQLRHTFERKSKKLQTAGRLQILTRPEDVDSAMDAFESVYSKSWKQPEPYPNFVREWARLCAERGWLRLGVASIDGVPIAAQFWFTTGRRAYIFKLAYDEAQSRWSAGTVLTALLLRHALEVDQVVEIDYLSGDDAYKKSWMTVRRERIGLMACNLRSVGGAAAAAGEVLGQSTAWFRHRRLADVS